MNKSKTKEIVSKNSILTPDWLLVKHNDQLDSVGNLGFPLVVKPNDQGSTIGLSIVDSKSQLLGAYSLARNFADSIIFERYIKGRELTCSIIGDKAYPVLEIIPKKDIYDYECKYTKGMSEYICPADLSESISLSIQDISLKAHIALGCRHYSRVDFLLDENDNIWFLEINTLPGMTETSLLPKSLKSAGVSFNEVIELIINEAYGVSK
jgi:D-alanine-D-alanine ligase